MRKLKFAVGRINEERKTTPEHCGILGSRKKYLAIKKIIIKYTSNNLKTSMDSKVYVEPPPFDFLIKKKKPYEISYNNFGFPCKCLDRDHILRGLHTMIEPQGVWVRPVMRHPCTVR